MEIDVRISAHRSPFSVDEWDYCSVLQWDVAAGDGRIDGCCDPFGRIWKIWASHSGVYGQGTEDKPDDRSIVKEDIG
jgi:hypothetical protein